MEMSQDFTSGILVLEADSISHTNNIGNLVVNNNPIEYKNIEIRMDNMEINIKHLPETLKHPYEVLNMKWNKNIKHKLICSKNGEELIGIIERLLQKGLDRSHIYIIDGPIGVGKTTLVNKILEKFADKVASGELVVCPECAMKYKNELNDFYADMKSNSFSFQLLNISDYEKQLSKIRKENKPCIYLFDRSIISILTFSTILHKDKMLTDEELSIIHKIFSKYNNFNGIDNIIYIHNNTDELLKRIAKRGREFEKGISREYLDNYNNISDEFGLILDEVKN